MNCVQYKTAADFDALFKQLAQKSEGRNPESYLDRWQGLWQRLAQEPPEPSLLSGMAQAGAMSKADLSAGLRVILTGLSHGRPDFSGIKVPCRRRVAIVAAGNIPGVAVAPAVALAAAGCPVVVKLSRSEPYFLPWLLEKWQESYAEPAGIVAHPWPADSPATEALLSSAETILAFGNDFTVWDIRDTYRRKQVFGFGQKFSIAWAGSSEPSPEQLRALAHDVALFRQNGCLSVQVVFVHGGKQEALGFARQFAPVLDDVARQFALPGAGLHSRQIQDELDLLGVHWARECRPHASCVIMPEKFQHEFMRGGCVVQVVPAQNIADTIAQIGSYWPALQGVSLVWPEAGCREQQELWNQQGVGYVRCAGQMQAPPLDWANGGIELPRAVCAG